MTDIIALVNNPLFLLAVTLWVLPWKGVALWKAARLYHKWWFIALLVLNTLAILEIIYIFVVARKAEQEEVMTTSTEE